MMLRSLTFTYMASALISPECRRLFEFLLAVRYDDARRRDVRGCRSNDVPVFRAVEDS